MNRGGEVIYLGAAALGMEGLCLLADPVPKGTSVSQQWDHSVSEKNPALLGCLLP